MNSTQQTFEAIQSDARYLAQLDWGKPRRGHPEGSVRKHIQQLEHNLATMSNQLDEDSRWKLKILIHVHDTFKAPAKRGVAIVDPRSHASLACQFLAEFAQDQDLLNMVQYHDEPYALWRQARRSDSYQTGIWTSKRFEKLIQRISDWQLFLRFLVIDNVTVGKNREPILWAADQFGASTGLRDSTHKLIELLESTLACRSTHAYSNPTVPADSN